MTDSEIETFSLTDCWEDSMAEPLALVETANPKSQAGSFVIEPGERVPSEGTTSHEGAEMSVILSGSVVLGGPDLNQEMTVEEESFVYIPARAEHYSRNDTDDFVKLVYVIMGDL